MKKIFLIDQEKFRCSLIEMSLKNEGISTFALQNPKESLNFIEDILPDIILVDLSTLLSSNGQFFLNELKLNNKISNIPMIAMGMAKDANEFNLLYKNIQFEHFIERPFSIAQLKNQIKGILKNVSLNKKV
ncbi:MAG: response regulator [Oligoflexia bacterium]|nr:response regulator [Oligoflexia bacterium]